MTIELGKIQKGFEIELLLQFSTETKHKKKALMKNIVTVE